MSKIKVTAVNKNTHTYDAKHISSEIKKKYGAVIPPDSFAHLIPPPHSGLCHRYDNIPTCIANGWRRTALDEIMYPRLNATDMTNIITNDPVNQRITDDIQNQIKITPNSYLPIIDDPGFEAIIHVENLTEKNIVVTTNDIKVVKWGSVPQTFKWNTFTRLCTLKPACHITIPIKIEWGMSKNHVSFGQFGPIRYSPYKFDTSVGSKTMPPSYTVVPMNYELGFLQCGMIKPIDAIKLTWETLRKTLEDTAMILLDVGDDEKYPYISSTVNIDKKPPGEIHFTFPGFCETMGNILAWYCFQDSKVAFVVAGKTAPYVDELRIKLILKKDDATMMDYINVLNDAIDTAIGVIRECVKGL